MGSSQSANACKSNATSQAQRSEGTLSQSIWATKTGQHRISALAAAGWPGPRMAHRSRSRMARKRALLIPQAVRGRGSHASTDPRCAQWPAWFAPPGSMRPGRDEKRLGGRAHTGLSILLASRRLPAPPVVSLKNLSPEIPFGFRQASEGPVLFGHPHLPVSEGQVHDVSDRGRTCCLADGLAARSFS
jgi:hypothetical protein